MEILLAGNTGYVTEHFLERAFPGAHILIWGTSVSKISGRRVTHIPSGKISVRELPDNYEPDRVVYFSRELTFHGESQGETEELHSLLRRCSRQKEVQMIYLAGPELQFTEFTEKSVTAEAAEKLCMYYSRKYGFRVKIIRLPWLYSALYEKDYLYQLFQKIKKQERISLYVPENWKLHFLSMEDLGELVYRVFDSWDGRSGILSVPENFGFTFRDLGNALKTLGKGCEIFYEKEEKTPEFRDCGGELRKSCGWFPRISLIADLPELWEQYERSRGKSPGKWEFLKQRIGRHRGIVRAVELPAGFLLTELLNRFSGSPVQFRYIDFRLLFVVIMGTVHGMKLGLPAAAMASLSLAGTYVGQGNSGLTLFYEPACWLPFILYFLTGTLCGYIPMKSRDTIHFLTGENSFLKEQLQMLRELYQKLLEERRGLKKQILTSRDSFGRIYDITRQLDGIQPEEIFIRAVQILEQVLENHSIAVYSVEKEGDFARLKTASREIFSLCPKSLNLKEYGEITDELKKNGVWANCTMTEGLPMYASAVGREGSLQMIVAVHKCSYEQMSLYYQNLLRVLCGLVDTALLRAMSCEEAARSRLYVEGTDILKEEPFREKLRLHRTMGEERLSAYTLLQLDFGERSLPEADRALEEILRENDISGISSRGNLYVILDQTSETDAETAAARLEQAGFGCRVISGEERDFL